MEYGAARIQIIGDLLVRLPRRLFRIVMMMACAVAPAQAQWVATPFMGVKFQKYFHFFKDRNVDVVPNNCGVVSRNTPCVDLNTRAWSAMGNVVAPLGSEEANWRPYGTAGLGRDSRLDRWHGQ